MTVVAARTDLATDEEHGLRLSDGTLIAADLVVLATGYEKQSEGVRRLCGAIVADRIGDVWGAQRMPAVLPLPGAADPGRDPLSAPQTSLSAPQTLP